MKYSNRAYFQLKDKILSSFEKPVKKVLLYARTALQLDILVVSFLVSYPCKSKQTNTKNKLFNLIYSQLHCKNVTLSGVSLAQNYI